MKQLMSTLTSKGQITLPVEVRRHLGVAEGDKILFILDDNGAVRMEVPRYTTLESLVGAAGSLREPFTWDQMMDIVNQERVQRYAAAEGNEGWGAGDRADANERENG